MILALDDPPPEQLRDYFAAFRQNTDAGLIVHNRAMPTFPRRGILDAQAEENEREETQRTNRQIRAAAGEFRDIWVLDYDALVARHRGANWRDEHRWALVGLPAQAKNLLLIVREWMRFLCPLSGRVAKAVVVDLDNSVWGGLVGEDGLEGIHLDDQVPVSSTGRCNVRYSTSTIAASISYV